MRSGFLVHALLAVEHHEVEPEAVKRGDEHAEQHAHVGERRHGDVGVLDRLDDGVLGVKAGEAREADERDGADEAGDPGNRHVLADPAHLAHVLLVMQGDDHRARGEEQQRLEESVGAQVKDGGGVGRGAQAHGHVAELGKRRVGDDPFDVVLHQA